MVKYFLPVILETNLFYCISATPLKQFALQVRTARSLLFPPAKVELNLKMPYHYNLHLFWRFFGEEALRWGWGLPWGDWPSMRLHGLGAALLLIVIL